MPHQAGLLFTAEAFIFDVDGTLVDSVDLHAEAWQRAFAHFGHEFTFEAIRSQIGKGGDQLMPVFLEPDVLEQEGKAIEKFRKELFEREYLAKVRGFPKVRDLFELLKQRGKRIALASSAAEDELHAFERVAGIEGLADVSTNSDDVERSKPHPDIFAAALDKLKLAAGKAVVVGDTPYDAEAASKAGIPTIGVLCGGFPESDIRKAGAVEIFRDPEDMLGALSRAAP